MSEETTAESASRLLADDIHLDGMTDAEIRRHVVVQMMDADDDVSDAYILGAFNALKNGGNPRMARARREQQKRRLDALHLLGSQLD